MGKTQVLQTENIGQTTTMGAVEPTQTKKTQVAISTEGYHWIDKAINSLDPYTDYDLIWKLMSSYKTSDFINNLNYTMAFPNFTIMDHAAATTWRDDGGKVLNKAASRAEASEQHNMIWWNYGSKDPRTRAATENVNKIHANLARRYPGHFSHNEDFLYVLCSTAIGIHRLRLAVGLPGLPENQKIAAHLYWKNMAPMFHVEGQGPVRDFPDSFEECIATAERYENQPRPYTAGGRNTALAVLYLFAYRYFPPGFRWVGYAWGRTFVTPSTMREYRIDPVNPVLAAFFIFLTKLILVIDSLLPDPKISFFESLHAKPDSEKQNRAQEIKSLDKQFCAFFNQNVETQACPFGRKQE
ncbi:hypothetical protein PpBr36_04251 [Pyricularia pennisetigena]|uniref:hypothetical protein n=1 Tax=Pyricularia pennisetigena TaxID=1578925 RepID=UPI00114E2221|nr:hypothetical protein PpBr36_04251 [Pyricularia pennisetigena]TLS26687.1 hypothetical protein PpBr36_04251 [Pyricularia pennisetigena]